MNPTNNSRRDVRKIKELLSLNPDSRQYFFSKADETWLEWLWTNGMLEELKKKSENPNQYSYRLPELDYLLRMAEKEPKLVAKIIESVPVSEETFNPEVIDRFFWIMGTLPADQIKGLIPKVLKENWNGLMSRYGKSGYEYKRIVEKLYEAKDFEALIEFAKVTLALRTDEELSQLGNIFISDKLFYLRDITETGIFEALLDSQNNKKEETLKAVLEVLSSVVKLGKEKEESIFEEDEPFYLLEIDIFSLEPDSHKRSHLREDIQNLVTVAKKLIEDLFTTSCGNEDQSRKLYESLIAPLPDSRTLYKLRLYTVTRCPHLFMSEIKELLFRLFKVGERYFEIENGAEYHKALLTSFDALSEEDKREYIAEVLKYFSKELENKDKEGWRKRDGLKILTYLKKKLTPEEIILAEKFFGKMPDEIEPPHPDVGKIRSGMVSHISPINPAEFSIGEIIEHLKTDWSPKILKDQYKGDDFLSPRGAEGLGNALKEDFKTRPVDYFQHLNEFFDREDIAPGYIYEMLRQVEDSLRADQPLTEDQIEALINFFDLIKKSGESQEFSKSEERSYLADWITVHKVIADILVSILRVVKDSETFKNNRKKMLGIIQYLLTIKSSPDAEDDEREAGEPFHVAINSVRGRAYECFVQFTGNDGSGLADDIKSILIWILDNDTSNAVRFVIGYYLATFYFRDKSFIQGLMSKIFPKGVSGQEKIYFATWEGYLANNLYKELYEELKDYYSYAITVDSSTYPDRKYLKGLDETLAGHLALAYAHFDLVPGEPLFDLFWNTPNETRHYEFTSFLGRHFLTRDTAGDKWFEDNKVSKQKLIDFWDWMLSVNIKIEPKAFSGFGFWINQDKEIIPDKIIVERVALSLQKSNGQIDWDYGLFRRIDKLAEVNPEKTLEIIKALLLLNGDINPTHRLYFDASNQIRGPLETIYKKDEMKKAVKDLINELISKIGRIFWDLKNIIE